MSTNSEQTAGAQFSDRSQSQQLPGSNVAVRVHDEADLEEYEKITGKRIRDLNTQRNILVETVMKEWKQSRASHYKFVDQNIFHQDFVVPSNEPILPEDIELPIIAHKSKR